MLKSRVIPFFQAHPNWVVFLGILAFWFLMFVTSGTLFSGFHFMDDHDIVAIHYHLTTKQMTVPQVIQQWLVEDHATGRFRTFYFIHRILQTKLLGIHFFLWSIYTGLLAVFTTFFLFIFGRLLKFSIPEALIFAFLITFGAQSAVWWYLGPAETIATFMLSLSLLLIALGITAAKYNRLYEAAGVFCAILMSLSKENFILLLPAIAFLQIWLAKTAVGSWRKAVLRHSLSTSVLLLVCLAELLFVKYFVGTTPEIGYAGFEGFNFQAIWRATVSLSTHGNWWIILIGLCLMVFSQITDADQLRNPVLLKKVLSQVLKKAIAPITLFLLITVPQVVLYAKSGISQRYLLPGIFAYSFLIVWIYRDLNQNSRNLSKFVVLLIAIGLSLSLHSTWNAAHIFALEGRSTNRLLSTIVAKTTPADKILLVTNPMIYLEWNYSIKKYLNYAADRPNMYVSTYEIQDINQIAAKLKKFYNYQTLETISDKKDIACIVVFPLLNKIFLDRSVEWFDRQNYQELVFGNFNRNLNPNSQINLYCKNPIKPSPARERSLVD